MYETPSLKFASSSFEVFVNTTVKESVPVEVVCLGKFLLLQSAESFNVQLYHISGLAELSYHSKKLKNTYNGRQSNQNYFLKGISDEIQLSIIHFVKIITVFAKTFGLGVVMLFLEELVT